MVEEIENNKECVKKPSSMKNANIRISKVNNTKAGQLIYELADIEKIIKMWLKEKEFEYFLIEHKEDVANIHYHIVLKFASPTRFDTIKNKIPFGDIQNSKSLKNSVQYLVHMNSPEKYQYQWEDIITNTKELNKYQLKSKVSEELDINFYIDEISKGNIREYEYPIKIPALIYSKFGSRIDRAFKMYYDKFSMDNERHIEVEFVFGAGGTGKTWFAKTSCIMNNESYCISSSSNDVMQDYKGQDVLILDDLRDDSFKFADLLKILDNHTRSSMSSRYRNKCFIGTRIVITSNMNINEWYKSKSKEDLHQLRRRIKSLMIFSNSFVSFYRYNEYEQIYKYCNEIENIFKTVPVKEEEEFKVDSRYDYLLNVNNR